MLGYERKGIPVFFEECKGLFWRIKVKGFSYGKVFVEEFF